jgi:hypothetical protein
VRPPRLSLHAKGAFRADDGTRTRYLELGKLALYPVSYVRVGRFYGRRAGLGCLPFVA